MIRLGVFLFALMLAWPAFGQTTVRPCITTGTNTCPPVSAAQPMPVTGTLTLTPSGTQDVNVASVGGNVVTTTVPVSGNIGILPSTAAAAAITPIVTSAVATGLILKNTAGNLYSLNIGADSTLAAAAWWAMVHNSATVPAAGAVTPLKCYPMALGTTMLALSFSTPIRFSTGISVSVSTNGCFTQADSAHAFISGDVQ